MAVKAGFRLFVCYLIILVSTSDTGAAWSQSGDSEKQLASNSDLFRVGNSDPDLEILCIKRQWPDWSKRKGKDILLDMGFPSNHECQSSLQKDIYENEIGVFNPGTGKYKTIYKPEDQFFVGQIKLHWNARKFLFTRSDGVNWKIFEMNTDGTGLRQVSQTPDDVDCFDPCYLPDGRIVFASNAPMQCVPCWHGVEKKYVANLYIMNPDGSEMRRLCFDQDHDMHPSVSNDGKLVYSRWDYTGISRIFLRPLMKMKPDGTGQRSIYGSNMWFPNGFYYPRELPGQNGRFLGIVAGYHRSFRSGKLAILDVNNIDNPGSGINQIHGEWTPLKPEIKDKWTSDSWPEFLTPSIIDDKHYLTSVWERPEKKQIGIYLANDENVIDLLHEEEGYAFLEPVPIVKQKVPPIIPDRVNLEKDDATVFIQDIYEGPGLKNVPPGTIKDLRVIAYDFGYVGMAGVDKIGLSGPWEAMRILGTTPVEKDGSAIFSVPANTPLAFQPLDENGNAVQLMRSWVSAMPGEIMSCIGCHESLQQAPVPRRSIASVKTPQPLKEWYGPARGFDFEREVQPVLSRYCVSCHNEAHELDLRAEANFPDYSGRYPGRLDYERLHPELIKKYDNKVLYTPAYEALLPYIRRVNAGDDVSLLEPGEYHVNTSELVQILKEGHMGIELDDESWSRVTTWIDMNAPCHGTWEDVYNESLPGKGNLRRWELAEMYGGPSVNPDVIPQADSYDETPLVFEYEAEIQAKRKGLNKIPELKYKSIDLGNGEEIRLVNFGAGYWMGSCEISNAQFRSFDAGHSSRYFGKRHREDGNGNGKGLALDGDNQPAVRVSWDRAMEFCDWLTEKTGVEVSLPTKEQWELACLAGRDGDFYFSGKDFSAYENMADLTFATYGYKGKSIHGHFQVTGDLDLVISEGLDLADRQFYDGACVTTPVGSYMPNGFGLSDMHGNAAEWTLSDFGDKEKTVKGGSYLDRPGRCSVDVSHGFPAWQNVYNVGFRIVIPESK
ncbi:MAG: SUMF1/EgtB/PvdO family nonheme iron enzyme [Bacteroidetes bacterium]|nr:SUMF1/EgtB/PvdO family nonheme iron enzyme [Bacteroidota bacterium]